ncbi:MAG TPA: 2-nitropropane dioxygenase, partial [Geobacteraceae bacterium]
MLKIDATGQPADRHCLGCWRPPAGHAPLQSRDLGDALRSLALPLFMVEREGALVAETEGTALFGANQGEGLPLAGYASPLLPQQLGNPHCCAHLGIRYPYLGGSMAKGISSAPLVEELGKAGMLGFFGAAGLPLAEVEAAVVRLASSLGHIPHGFNLIHS